MLFEPDGVAYRAHNSSRSPVVRFRRITWDFRQWSSLAQYRGSAA
jgi:hypothetical protein